MSSNWSMVSKATFDQMQSNSWKLPPYLPERHCVTTQLRMKLLWSLNKCSFNSCYVYDFAIPSSDILTTICLFLFSLGSQSVLTYATSHGLICGWDLRSSKLAWKLENDPAHGKIKFNMCIWKANLVKARSYVYMNVCETAAIRSLIFAILIKLSDSRFW